LETREDCKQQAMLALQTGKLLEADRWLRKAQDTSDSDVELLRLSAQVSGQLGRYKEAAEYCERVLALNPADALAWAFLGNARIANEEYERALEAFNKAVGLAPDVPMILVNRGSALFLLNRHKEAIDCLHRALELAPGTANAYFNLGRIYKTLGDFGRAVMQFEQALRYDPDLADAYINLSGIYFELGRLQDAERITRHAIDTHRDAYHFRNSLVQLYKYRGEYDQALEECEILLGHAPDNITALGFKADLLERKGDYAQAYALIRELAASGRLDITGLETFARLCHRFDACEEAARVVHAKLQTMTLDEQRRSLHFALGRIYDHMGRYGEAIEHYTTANRLAGVSYDPEKTTRRLERLARTFSRERLQDMPRAGNHSSRPVFIVGMPRSGTSLVEQILSSHPDIHGAGELTAMNELADSIQALTRSRQEYPECATELDTEQMNQLADIYLTQLQGISPDARRVVDKMPGNFRHLGLISRLLPGARIIHCRRDPRDTCVSIFFQSFNQTHAYGTDLATLGRYYRDYERLMAHWRSVIDVPLYEIQYENLVADQERYSRELVEFCSLDWDARCLEFHKTRRDVATASYDQVRRPMYRSSLERWRRYEPWIQPLLDALESTS